MCMFDLGITITEILLCSMVMFKSPLCAEADSETQLFALTFAELQNHDLTFHMHSLSHNISIFSYTMVGSTLCPHKIGI